VYCGRDVYFSVSVLWRCWLGGRKGVQPVKKLSGGCWCGYLSGARCKLAYVPADATAIRVYARMYVCIYYIIFFYILRTSRMFLCCWQEFHVTSVITRWSKTCCGCRESRLFTPWTSGRSRSTKSSSLYIWPSVRILCTHPFNGPFLGLPGWAGTRKVKPVWILLKQETVSGSGINWAICKSAPHSRQITTPAPHHSVFYRPDALPATKPTASKHWRCISYTAVKPTWLDSTGRRSSILGVTQGSFTVLLWYCFVSLFLYSLVTLYH